MLTAMYSVISNGRNECHVGHFLQNCEGPVQKKAPPQYSIGTTNSVHSAVVENRVRNKRHGQYDAIRL